MSKRPWAQRWTLTGVLAALACGGLTTREDEQAQGGQGAGWMVTPGQGGSPAAGGVSSSSGGSVVGVGGKARHGKGGSVGDGGSTAIDSCPVATPVVAGLITEFEGDTELFEGGGYYTYQDTPDGQSTSATVPTAGGFSGGKALYFGGTGLPPEARLGFGVWLHCVDATDRAGLRFWLVGEGTIDVAVVTTATKSTEFGGSCTAQSCISNFVRVEADSLWTEVTIRFEDLAGGSSPFEPYEIVGINFDVGPPAGVKKTWGFDVWVDELAWFDDQPSGAAGYGGAP